MRKGVKLQAHTGVQSEYPENTMLSFIAAAEQGYEMIELDLGVTKDRKIIVLHDEAINSKARYSDGRKIEKNINISDITYSQALEYDFGIWFSEKFKGTKLPLFEAVLTLAKENDILLKIDNKIRKFSPENLNLLFDMIRKSGARVCVSCWNDEIVNKVFNELPGAEISFDGLTDENKLKQYSDLFGKDKFSVWMPVDFSMASWAPSEWFATEEKCELIKKYAKFCIWAIESVESFEKATELYHPYAAETTGIIKPE